MCTSCFPRSTIIGYGILQLLIKKCHLIHVGNADIWNTSRTVVFVDQVPVPEESNHPYSNCWL